MEFGKINKEIAQRKKESKGQDKCEELVEKSKEAKKEIEQAQLDADALQTERNKQLNLIGNILGDQVPIFNDEENNEVVETWGQIPELEIDGKTLGHLHHHEIMGLLDIVEFERGQKVAGHRGYFLKGLGVLLN